MKKIIFLIILGILLTGCTEFDDNYYCYEPCQKYKSVSWHYDKYHNSCSCYNSGGQVIGVVKEFAPSTLLEGSMQVLK